MKKFYLVLLIGLFAGGSVMADVVTTQRRIQRPADQSKQQTPGQVRQKPVITNYQQRQKSSGNKLADNMRMCKPYSETLDSDVMGVNFNFRVSIDGWVNNRCRVNFVAQSTGINKTFKQLYGVDASQAQIYTFEPRIRCEFTKQQLLSVGDSILQENERNAGASNNMLKNPMDIELPSINNMSTSDVGLMNVILNDRACTILNAPDSNRMFESLFGY